MSRGDCEPAPWPDAAAAGETLEAGRRCRSGREQLDLVWNDRDEGDQDEAEPERIKRLCRRPQHATAAPGEDQGHDAEQDPECLGRPAVERTAFREDDDMPVAEEEGDERRQQDRRAGRITQHQRPREQERRRDPNDDKQDGQDLSDVRLAQVRGVEEEDGVAGKQQRMDRKRLAGEKREIDVLDEFGTR